LEKDGIKLSYTFTEFSEILHIKAGDGVFWHY